MLWRRDWIHFETQEYILLASRSASQYIELTCMAFPIDPWGFTDGKKTITSLICLSLIPGCGVDAHWCTAGGWSLAMEHFSVFLSFFFMLPPSFVFQSIFCSLFLASFFFICSFSFCLSCPCPDPLTLNEQSVFLHVGFILFHNWMQTRQYKCVKCDSLVFFWKTVCNHPQIVRIQFTASCNTFVLQRSLLQ